MPRNDDTIAPFGTEFLVEMPEPAPHGGLTTVFKPNSGTTTHQVGGGCEGLECDLFEEGSSGFTRI